MRLFDSHAHLSDERFKEDLDAVVANMREHSVHRVLLPASDLKDSYEVVRIVERYPNLMYAAVGVHPHEASSFTEETLSELHQLLQHPQVVALGEIGLDYHYDFSPREIQKDVFRKQMELAYEEGKPVILHDREAHGDFLMVLQDAAHDGLLLDKPGVVHCYSGSPEFAQELLKLGFYLGYDGPITFKNAKKAQASVQLTPQDRLLIETDSPYLAPVPYRGKRNEPAYVVEVCKKVSELWGLSLEETAELTYRNSCTLFGI